MADARHRRDTGKQLGRYRLEQHIASGGMADVYLAREVGEYALARAVALKVLKEEVSNDDDNVRMFLREALVAEGFHHPNLVPVYEAGSEGGKMFLAMELVRGISVATLMLLLAERGRSIPIPLAVRIACDVLDGLAYAHEATGADGAPLNVVHRDVTPQNVLISEDGVVKLVDFGIVRAETELGRTQVARVKGKFSYMSPEQWEPGAHGLDARADLFSLGVSLFEMSTGSGRLFKGSSPPQLYQAVVHDPIPRPSERVPDYPADLERVLMMALERDVMKRWPSARALRAALGDVMRAHHWEVETSTLAKLVEFAMGGQAIEARWERIDAGEIPSPGDDAPTLIEDAQVSGRPSLLRPASVFPKAMDALRVKTPVSVARRSLPPTPVEPAYELGEVPKELEPVALEETSRPIAVAAAGMSSRVKWALAAVALAGWATAGATIGLWLRESHRADALERRLALRNAVTAPLPPPRPPTTVMVPATTTADAATVAAPESDTLLLAADPGLASTVASAWARAFAQGPGGTRVALTPGDARAMVRSGRAMVGLFLTAGHEPRAATERVVGYDVAAVVVHPSNPVRALSVAELGELFAGQTSSWHAVRGTAAAPRLVLPAGETSAVEVLRTLVLARSTPALTLASVAELVPDDAAAVRMVAADPRAVAVVSLGAVNASVRALGVTGASGPAVLPTAVTVRTLRYPLLQALVLGWEGAGPPTRSMEGFTALTTSAAGQRVLATSGYVGR